MSFLYAHSTAELCSGAMQVLRTCYSYIATNATVMLEWEDQ